MAETFRNVEFMTAAEQKTMWCDAMSGVVWNQKHYDYFFSAVRRHEMGRFLDHIYNFDYAFFKAILLDCFLLSSSHIYFDLNSLKLFGFAIVCGQSIQFRQILIILPADFCFLLSLSIVVLPQCAAS